MLSDKQENSKYRPFYFRISNKDASFFVKFLRIFSLYLLSFIPIIISHILLFCNNAIDFISKTYVFEAIGYVQTLIFVIISYGILIICQVVSKLRQQLDFKHRTNQPKKVIDTGIVYLITVCILLITVFVITSVIFVEMKAKNNDAIIAEYIYSYTFILIPYIFSLIIGNFFIYVCLVSGFHWVKIFIGCFASLIFEIVLCYIFITYIRGINIIILLTLPSLIVAIIRCITFICLYLFKIRYFNKKQEKLFLFDQKLYKELFIVSMLSSLFTLAFMVANIIQTIFIAFAYKLGDTNFDYLWSNGKHAISYLLLAKINVYNFLYLIYSSAKSFRLAIIDHEKPADDYVTKIIKTRKWNMINLKLNLMNLAIALFLSLFIKHITINLFSSFEWITNSVYNLPPQLKDVKTAMELIVKMSQMAMIIGAFGYFLMDLSLNIRTIIYKMYKRNYWIYNIVMLEYILCFSVLTYLLVYQTNNVFYGLNGYMFSVVIYGLLFLLTMYSIHNYKQYKYFKLNYNNLKKVNYGYFLIYHYKLNNLILKNAITNNTSNN